MIATRIRTSTLTLLLTTAVAGLAVAGPATPVAAAKPKPKTKPKPVQIVGFRASGSHWVEPGGTITRACSPHRIVARVSLRNVRRGALVRRRWRHDGDLVKGKGGPWKFTRKHKIVTFRLSNPQTLPDGRYQLAIKVPGKRWAVARIHLEC